MGEPKERELAELFRLVKENSDDTEVARRLAKLANSPGFSRAIRREVSRFSAPREEVEPVSLLWETMRKIPKWEGGYAFYSYFIKHLRGYLRDSTKSLYGIARLTPDENKLYDIACAVIPSERANKNLRELLADNLAVLVKVAKLEYGWSYAKTVRVCKGVCAKRGTITVSLEETPEIPAGDPPELSPDYVPLLVKKLVTEKLIPPPPNEIAQALLTANFCEDDEDSSEGIWAEGYLDGVWEKVAREHPELELKPSQLAKLFFNLRQKILRFLRKNYPESEPREALLSWILGELE